MRMIVISKENKGEREYERKLRGEMHTGTGMLRAICSLISSVFMTLQQSCKTIPQSWLQCNQHPHLQTFSLFRLWGLSVPLLWSFFRLCCEPAQPRGEVTFSINHHYRKLILSSREHTSTHSLMIDWNPARSGSLTVRQHQSWYSPALHRNPMKENPSAEVGSKERNRARARGNWQIPSWQGSWSSAVDTPTWHLSLWRSLFSLSLSDCFSFLKTHSLLSDSHSPPLCLPAVS